MLILSPFLLYRTLAETILQAETELEPFPPPEKGAFLKILNEEMGYSD